MTREPVILEARVNEYALRTHNPQVPWSPEEIARAAADCAAAGASVIHFHARDPETGGPCHEAAVYADAVRRIRAAAPEVIVVPTLGATEIPDPVRRCAALEEVSRDPASRPDLAPLDLVTLDIDAYDPQRGFLVDELVYHNPLRGLRGQLERLRAAGVAPEAVLWSIGAARRLSALLDRGELREPLFCELVVSDAILSTAPATARGLLSLHEFLPRARQLPWVVLAPGGSALHLVPTAVELGGGVALGLGDWAYPELGRPDNASVIREAARLVRSCGSRPAAASEARSRLGLARS